MNKKNIFTVLCSLIIFSVSLSAQKTKAPFPDGFVYISDLDPSIILDMRYYGNHNFIGKPVDGYLAPKCILSKEAALALVSVQTELKKYSMSLKIYDCYRPQKAVDNFVAWAKDIKDTKMKKEFYPKVDKRNLFKDGFIAKNSSHSRGSTVDLTIVPLPAPKEPKYIDGETLKECYLPVNERFKDNSLDFGTGFDCFDPWANTANPNTTFAQKKNRLLLKSMMEKNGFKSLSVEWWHYTLSDEPFPSDYFNFVIQ